MVFWMVHWTEHSLGDATADPRVVVMVVMRDERLVASMASLKVVEKVDEMAAYWVAAMDG